MSHLFSIRTRLLAAVAKWTHTDDNRPHLHRVLFDGKHMVATDGHRMVVVPCETDMPPFALGRVDCAILAAAQREITKRDGAELRFVAIDIYPGRPVSTSRKALIELDEEGLRSLLVPAPDPSDFPRWQQLFEGQKAEPPTPPTYAFEPRYLAGIDEVLEAVDGARNRTVEVKAWTANEPGGHVGPMLFESGGIRFLIMPKRS